MGITTELYKIGARSISCLQLSFPNAEGFFTKVTEISDPAYAFSIAVPLAAGFNTLLAADILVVSLFAEWSNTLLKWFLMEDRPFWWVREAEIVGLHVPTLRQTPFTCETGPGSPSGHVMGAATLLFVVQNWILHQISVSLRLSDRTKKIFTILLWCFSITFMVFVGLSRLYVATHFPHQCVLGFFCGIAVYCILARDSTQTTRFWRRGSRRRLLGVAALLVLISVAAYWIQRAVGIDPQWSVRMAFKWCEKPEYLHVDTTPIFSLVRDCGAAIGLALASPVQRTHLPRGSHLAGMGISFLTAGLFRMCASAVPSSNVMVFYGVHCLLYSAQAWALLWLVPQLAGLQLRLKRD